MKENIFTLLIYVVFACDEYALDKEEFQSNIINNFIEGKDCVSFDW